MKSRDAGFETALVRAAHLVFSETPEVDDAALEQQARAHVRHAVFVAIVEARFGPARARRLLEAHVASAPLAHRCLPHLAELAALLVAEGLPGAPLADDLLGTVHESWLARRLERGSRGIVLVPSPERARRGAHYTPRALVRFMVEESLGRWLWQSPVPSAEERAGLRTLSRAGRRAARGRRWHSAETLAGLRVLDPACGAGAFLVAALETLGDYHAARAAVFPEEGDRRDDARGRAALLQSHLFGVDVDAGALEAARLTLTLAVLGRAEPGSTEASRELDPGDLPDLARNLVRADTLGGQLGQHLPEGGFDVVLGNPPYVSGESLSRAARQASRGFELGQGGRPDLWRLFYERTVRDLLRAGGVHAFVVPDALLARDEHAPVRGFLARHLAVTRVCHVGRAFGRAGSNVPVGVSAVVVVGDKRAPGERELCAIQEWLGDRASLAREIPASRLADPDGRPWAIHAAPEWSAVKASLLATSVRLGSLLAPGPRGITRGEELGKSSLENCPTRGCAGRGRVAILAGEDLARHRVRPPRVQVAASAVRKPAAYYAAPRILVVKTGAGPVAAASLESTPVLQSVYVLHLSANPRVSENAVAGIVSSALVTVYVYYEWTSGKRTQPQLTIGEIRALPVPDPARSPPALWRRLDARVASVRSLLEKLDGGVQSISPRSLERQLIRDEREIDRLVARLYGLELDECLPALEPALARLPRSQRPRWFHSEDRITR